MGQQIQVLDLVRQPIASCGYFLDEDISITVTGLRLGEEVYADLAEVEERVKPTPVDRIMRAAPNAEFRYPARRVPRFAARRGRPLPAKRMSQNLSCRSLCQPPTGDERD